MNRTMKYKIIIVIVILSEASGQLLFAGSATWKTNPASTDWNTAANWTPRTVPNGPADVATFGSSNQTSVSLSAPVEVSALTFNAGASAFTITTPLKNIVTFSGAGIINN